jgi:hypothetical protein
MGQENAVTAIDIALEPDATMMQRAQADNLRLLKAFPKGFALDETHHPHVTMLQQFVPTANLDKVYASAEKVLTSQKPTNWKLKAFKYYYIPSPPIGLAGIVVELTENLLRLQQELIDAVRGSAWRRSNQLRATRCGHGTRRRLRMPSWRSSTG